MINFKSGFDYEQDIELRAVQNEDFEQQYLGQCLRETKRENSSVLPQVMSRTLSAKSLEAKYLHSPHSPDSRCEENMLVSNIQSPKVAVLQEKVETRRKSQVNTESSFMSLFFIGRFIEKLSLSRKRLGNLNETHFNLIGDKASDKQTLFSHSKRLKGAGFNLKRMKTLFRRDTEVKDITAFQQVKEDLRNLRKPIFNCVNAIITKIPIIQPESLFKMYWDFFTSFFRIILLVQVPLEIAFTPGILFDHLIDLTYIILIILQIDFLIRINTLSYKNGAAIKDKWELVIHQLKKEFLTDFSTSLILIIFMILPDMKTKFNLFLLAILAQHKYVYETFAKSDQISYLTRPQRGIVGLLKFILTLLYILHLFSCIWFYFSSIDIEYSWISINSLKDSTWEEQYLEALYFAVITMLTIGYGDMVPKNSIEKIVTMVFVLGACLWVSYSVNFIGSIIDDITQNQVERNRRMRVINKYMIQRKIPYGLQHQVKEYLTYRWKEDDEVDLEMEQTLLEQLSDELKEELDKQAHKIFIQKSEFLQKYFSEEFRNALFKSIKRKIVPPQNTFSIDFGNELHLCFVEQGFIIFQHPDRKQRSKMSSTINQGQFFCVRDFIMNNPHLEQFKALGYVSLLVLSKFDFMETLKDFPEDFQKYCQLKDIVTLSYYPPALENGVFCPACVNFTHSISTCPQIQYAPNREAVIKKHCISQIQERHPKYKRTTIQMHEWHTRTMKDLCQQYASVFQNENQQSIINQTKIQLTVDQADSNSSVDDANSPGFKIAQNAPLFQTQNIKQTRASRIVGMPNNSRQQQESRQNLNQALQNRKQSILTGGISLGFGKNPLPIKQPIVMVDEIKESESDSDSQKSSSEEDGDQFTIQDFNDSMTDNVTNLYNQLHRHLELNENDSVIKKALAQLETIYWSFNQQKLDDFEMKSTYEYYFPQQNVDEVISYVKPGFFDWQIEILNKMRIFMLYPFLYVINYLRLRRKAKLKSITPLKVVAKVSRTLATLKKTLKLKKRGTLVRTSLKIGQVAPDDPFQRYKN